MIRTYICIHQGALSSKITEYYITKTFSSVVERNTEVSWELSGESLSLSPGLRTVTISFLFLATFPNKAIFWLSSHPTTSTAVSPVNLPMINTKKRGLFQMKRCIPETTIENASPVYSESWSWYFSIGTECIRIRTRGEIYGKIWPESSSHPNTNIPNKDSAVN